jgi:hypothetical protein
MLESIEIFDGELIAADQVSCYVCTGELSPQKLPLVTAFMLAH